MHRTASANGHGFDVPAPARIPDGGTSWRALFDGLTIDRRVLPPGMLINHSGEPPRVCAVVWGAVELTHRAAGRRVTLQIARANDMFGDAAMLAGTPPRFEARTLELSELVSVSAAEALQAVAVDPSRARRWLRSMAERVDHLEMRLVEVLGGGLQTRLATLLLNEQRDGVVELSQFVIADLIGVHRSSVNRTLKAFELAGLIVIGYRSIRVVDVAGLQRVGGSLSVVPAPAQERGRT